MGLLNLVKEEVPGLVHLLHVPSSEQKHGVEVIEGILLGLSESLIGFELKLVAVVDPGEIASNFFNKNTVHLEIRIILEPSREIEIEDVLEWSASLGSKADLEPLGRGPCIKLQFGLSLVLLGIIDVVLHHVVEHYREHAALLSVALQLHESVVLVLVLDGNFSHGEVLLHGPLGVHGTLNISGDMETPHTSGVQVEVHAEVLASELRVHLQVQLHFTLVQVSDTSPLLSVDGSLDGHLLAWDTVNLQLPLVVLLEVEEHMQLGLPVRLDGDVKERLGHLVVVVDGNPGLPHTALHLPVENKGSLLGPVSQEHELLDELVVNLHVKEAIDGRASVELDVHFHVIEGSVPDEPCTGNLDVCTATLEGVGRVGVLQLEEDSHGGEVELLVPFSSAPLQTEARLLRCCEEALEAINKLLHGDDSGLGGGHTEGHKADQQQACHLVL